MAKAPKKKLTDKQSRFVEEYLVDLNATQAAIRAGYSETSARSTAFDNLQKQEIQDAISKEQEKRSKRTHVDQDWVITRLRSVAERSLQAERVTDRAGNTVLVENKDGDMVPAYTFNAAGANKALELLGKNIGMFTDKTELTGKNGGPIEFKAGSELEIARKIAFILAKGMKAGKDNSDD